MDVNAGRARRACKRRRRCKCRCRCRDGYTCGVHDTFHPMPSQSTHIPCTNADVHILTVRLAGVSWLATHMPTCPLMHFHAPAYLHTCPLPGLPAWMHGCTHACTKSDTDTDRTKQLATYVHLTRWSRLHMHLSLFLHPPFFLHHSTNPSRCRCRCKCK